MEDAQRLKQAGKAARQVTPFSDQAKFIPRDRDPVTFIESGNRERLPELLELRKERMSASPFAFYRGTAALMTYDLAAQPLTGKHVVLCGDAHIANFGFYASPERRLIFDLNDFDESAPGPWEWDVKRLVTSVILCGESLGFHDRQIADAAKRSADSYRTGLRRMMKMDALDRFYMSMDDRQIEEILHDASRKIFIEAAQEARNRTSEQVVKKFTETDNGRTRFVENPPIMTHIAPKLMTRIRASFAQYCAHSAPDVALFLAQYTLTDVTRRVVGVGSVGTRSFLLLLTAADGSHLVLQIKEAKHSAISENCPPLPGIRMCVPVRRATGSSPVSRSFRQCPIHFSDIFTRTAGIIMFVSTEI
ncbi:DUF2252 family protein [Sporolactobacillus sp. Y61]|uniref:DUF2252 family protein n=1 Tax=Sporolactobacillus sp. Y61 TaxID=3160863 RepID=A0AAU8IGK5_9BACL